MFHELGFSLIRLQTYPAKGEQDSEARESSKRLQTLSPDQSNVIVYQDEVHFSIQSTVARECATKGSKPQVKSYAGRKNASYSGFFIPSDGRLYVSRPLWFNWEATIESLRQFIAQCKADEINKRIVLVMDYAPWHKKAIRLVEKEPEYHDIRIRMTFVSLPPYFPDLNPIELVWRITGREKAHNHFWPDFKSLSTTLDSWFASLSNPNEKFGNLCPCKPN